MDRKEEPITKDTHTGTFLLSISERVCWNLPSFEGRGRRNAQQLPPWPPGALRVCTKECNRRRELSGKVLNTYYALVWDTGLSRRPSSCSYRASGQVSPRWGMSIGLGGVGTRVGHPGKFLLFLSSRILYNVGIRGGVVGF